jgi:hypothetical protein
MLSRFTDASFEPLTATKHSTQLTDPGDPTGDALSRWEDEQLFEEDLRAVLNMLRPNRAGWAGRSTAPAATGSAPRSAGTPPPPTSAPRGASPAPTRPTSTSSSRR